VTQVSWAIYTAPSSTTPLYNGVDYISSSTPAGYLGNGFFTVSDWVFSVGSLNLSAGVYWLALYNAITANGGIPNGAATYLEVNTNSSGPNTPYTPNNSLAGATDANGGIPYNPNLSDLVFSVNGTTSVPEPTTMLLLGLGLIGLAGVRRKFKNQP
jgi:PEP-CTERM motif